MTHEKIIEALAKVIEPILTRRAIMQKIDGYTLDASDEIAAAVLGMVGPKPLVWDKQQHYGQKGENDHVWCLSRSMAGDYGVGFQSPFGFWSYDDIYGEDFGDDFPTLEAAQAAAQAHADEQWLASLPLGELLGGDG